MIYAVQPVTVQASTVRCDTEGCCSHVLVSHDIDEAQAAAMVRAIGWSARSGVHRWQHHCERHREGSQR